jgi:uncharacterized protein YkwD
MNMAIMSDVGYYGCMGNWLDIAIVIVLCYYAIRGYHEGIITIIIQLAGYVVSFILALRFGGLGASIIAHFLPNQIPQSYEDSVGIVLILIICMVVYYFIAPLVLHMIPPFITHNIANRIVGVAGSTAKGILVLSIGLYLASILPLPQNIQGTIKNSRIATVMTDTTSSVEQNIGGNITNQITNSVKELTLIPNNVQQTTIGSQQVVNLGFTDTSTAINSSDEITMFNFVNQQRADYGLKPLTMNLKLQVVSENYGKYMFAHGFFGHITPQGQTPLNRVQAANIPFTFIGENIAKAANVQTADTGFMNSPEHRANILNPNYTQIGVGVVNAGSNGEIFVQDFIGS